MKQVLQSLSDGVTSVAEVPCPSVRPGHVLIRTSRSLVSAGTERMLVEFGKAGLLDKARQQPDKVKDVLDKIRADGLLTTLDAVKSKLDSPLALGYCNAGRVLEVGPGVEGLEVGDRVVSNGSHAEVVCVPRNLCARIPAEVDDEAAAFTVLASIGLQGIRLAQPTLGESFAVTGLGLIGLVTVQLLRAHGCRVLGIDMDPAKLQLARGFGAETVDLAAGEDPVARALAFSRGQGVDGVIITASTKSNEPVHQAAQMCRKRGRVVLVGVVGLELSRADFYEKELSFQVSCSYGPGRYDPAYEEQGHDYPLGFVRWTEQRNFEAVLDMLATGRLDVRPLISHRFGLDEAPAAYELLTSGAPSLGIVLEYPDDASRPEKRLRARRIRYTQSAPQGSVRLGVIGAGNYASRVLLPALTKAGAQIVTIASSGGVSGSYAARKFGAHETTTDTDAVLADERVNAVVIATRHNSHARLVVRALEAGKHVFVEKPLALTLEELREIETVLESAARDGVAPLLTVGFNRRLAPHVVRMKELLAPLTGPKCMVMTVNAGAIPPGHWTQDPEVGGGRIIGEGCHFIDLLRHLAGSPIASIDGRCVGRYPGAPVRDDKATITLTFEDGSLGTVHYFANGHKAYPKERVEVFCGGRVLVMDNYRRFEGHGWKGLPRLPAFRQDKGQEAWAAEFVRRVTEGLGPPIGIEELLEVSRATIEVGLALRGSPPACDR